MKWFVILGVLVGAYTFMLMYTTDSVMNQTRALQTRYQQAAVYAEQLSGQLNQPVDQPVSQAARQP